MIAFAGIRDIYPIARHVLVACLKRVSGQSNVRHVHLASILYLLAAQHVTDVQKIQIRLQAAQYVSVKPDSQGLMAAIAPLAGQASTRLLRVRTLAPCALVPSFLKSFQPRRV